jgi:hypothetical protein
MNDRKSKKSGDRPESFQRVDDVTSRALTRGELRRLKAEAMNINRRSALKRSPRLCGRQVRSNADYPDREIPMRMRFETDAEGVVQRRVTFGSLMRCGSVWVCPHCAVIVAARRRVEISKIVNTWLGAKKQILFLTLTMKHRGTERLDDLWDGKQAAWEAVQKSPVWKALKKSFGLTGFVCATEVTYGEPAAGGNGWHVHIHVLLFMTRSVDDEEQLDSIRSALFKSWADALVRLGFDAPALNGATGQPLGADLRKIRTGGIAGYFSKVAYLASVEGISYELTSGNTSKKGRGSRRRNRTPLQLLQGLVEEQSQVKSSLPRIWFDLPGRRGSPLAKVTYEGNRQFLLHNPNRVGVIVETPADAIAYVDETTGETWQAGDVFLEPLPQLSRHSAWFEFQSVVFGFSPLKLGKSRKSSRQQITRSQRKNASALKRPLTSAELLWNKSIDSAGDDLSDEQIVNLDVGGRDHALISNSSWLKILAADDLAQVRLLEALEVSDSEATRVATELGVTLVLLSDPVPGTFVPDESDLQRDAAIRDAKIAEQQKKTSRLADSDKRELSLFAGKPRRKKVSRITYDL